MQPRFLCESGEEGCKTQKLRRPDRWWWNYATNRFNPKGTTIVGDLMMLWGGGLSPKGNSPFEFPSKSD